MFAVTHHVGVGGGGGGGYGIIYGRGDIRGYKGESGVGVMPRVRVVVGQNKHGHFRYHAVAPMSQLA